MGTKPTRLVRAVNAFGWMAAWFTANSAIGQPAERQPERPLYTISAAGGQPQRITTAIDRQCGSPDWSPDGKWIAFDSWPVSATFENAHIFVVRTDGTGTRDLGLGNMPSWSPDGTHLVCFTYHDNDPITIDVLRSDGKGRESILNHWGCPRWSPRGNRIATIASDRTIALFDLATGREVNIFGPPHSLWLGLDVSPDGLRFCFGDASGGVDIATLDERTMRANVRTVVDTGTCHQCSWAPDGRRIVFGWQATDQDLCQLYLMDVDSPQPPTPIAGQDKSRNNCDPDWSRDGSTIVYVSQSPAPPDPNP